MKSNFGLIFCFFILLTIQSYSALEEVDITQDVRILKLIPSKDVLFSLGIEPAIPENFIAMDANGGKDYALGVCWGPEEVLRAYYKDPKSISQPIIECFLSTSIIQHFSDGFDKMQVIAQAAELNFTVSFGTWGVYPYFFGAGMIEGKSMHNAWVGLNHEGGAVLTFHLISPEKDGEPTQEGIALWNKFIKETEQLPEPLFYKVLGQEMHPGYTIVDVGGLKAKVIAERRKSDKKLQYVVIPLDTDLEFEFQEAVEIEKGGKWHYKEPLLKIKGIFNKKIKNSTTTTFYVAGVFIKETDEFTKIDTQNKGIYFGQK